MSTGEINPPVTASHNLSLKIVLKNNSRIRLEFKRSFLKQDKVTFNSNSVLNIFIVYELDTWLRDLNTDFTLKDRLLGSLKLFKNADLDKYKYSSYRIVFDSCLEFLLTDGSVGKSVIILELI